MPLWVNILVQVVAGLAQVANLWSSLIPEDTRPYVTAGITTIQIVVGLVAHYYNPNGDPARAAWDGKLVRHTPPLAKAAGGS